MAEKTKSLQESLYDLTYKKEKKERKGAVTEGLLAGGKTLAKSISSPLVTTLKSELSPIGMMSESLSKSPELMMGMKVIGDSFSAMKNSMSESFKDVWSNRIKEDKTGDKDKSILEETKQTNKSFLDSFKDGWKSFIDTFKKSQPAKPSSAKKRVQGMLGFGPSSNETAENTEEISDTNESGFSKVSKSIKKNFKGLIGYFKKDDAEEDREEKEKVALKKSESESAEGEDEKKLSLKDRMKAGGMKGLAGIFKAFKWLLNIGKIFLGLGIAALIAMNGPEVIEGFFKGLMKTIEWIAKFMKDPSGAMEDLAKGVQEINWGELVEKSLNALGKAWEVISPIIGKIVSSITSGIGNWLTSSFKNEEGEFEWGKLFSWDNILSFVQKGGGLLAIGTAISTLLFGLSNTISMIKMPFQMAGGAWSMAKGAASLLGFGGDDSPEEKEKKQRRKTIQDKWDNRKKTRADRAKRLKVLERKEKFNLFKNKVQKRGGAVLSTGWEKGKDLIGKGWDKVRDMKKPDMGGIMGKLFSGLGKAGSFIVGMGQKLIMPLVSMGPVGWTILGGIALGGLFYVFWDEISGAWNSVTKSISEGINAVLDTVSGLASGAQSMVGTFLRSVGADIIADWIDPDGADKTKPPKKFTWGGFAEEVWNIYKGIWSGIIKGIKKAISGVGNLAKRAMEWMGAPEWLMNLFNKSDKEKSEEALTAAAEQTRDGGNIDPETQKILDDNKMKKLRAGRGGAGELTGKYAGYSGNTLKLLNGPTLSSENRNSRIEELIAEAGKLSNTPKDVTRKDIIKKEIGSLRTYKPPTVQEKIENDENTAQEKTSGSKSWDDYKKELNELENKIKSTKNLKDAKENWHKLETIWNKDTRKQLRKDVGNGRYTMYKHTVENLKTKARIKLDNYKNILDNQGPNISINPKSSTPPVQEQEAKGKPSAVEKMYKQTNQKGIHPENIEKINELINNQKNKAQLMIDKFKNPEDFSKSKRLAAVKLVKSTSRDLLRKNAEKNPIYRDMISKDPELIKKLNLTDLFKKQDDPKVTKSQMQLSQTMNQQQMTKENQQMSNGGNIINNVVSTNTTDASSTANIGAGPNSNYSPPPTTATVGQ